MIIRLGIFFFQAEDGIRDLTVTGVQTCALRSTHASVVDIGLFREPKASKRKEGALYQAGPGAGTTYKLPPAGGFADQLRYVGYPDAMIPAMAAAWSDRQRALVADSGFMPSAATLVPHLGFVHNWPQIDADGTVAPFISLRPWQPVSERETEGPSWFAVDAAAPDDFKRRSYKAYLMCFGISGMFEQDDVENWVSITDMAAGSMARRLTLNSRMGLTSEGKPLKRPLATFAGPGVAYQDRKSTRLNSSHSQISYAVFCLKKKKKQQISFLPVAVEHVSHVARAER